MMLNKRNRRISKIVTYALLVIFSLYCIFPFIWMLISALKPKTEIRTATPTFLIQEPTLENTQPRLISSDMKEDAHSRPTLMLTTATLLDTTHSC